MFRVRPFEARTVSWWFTQRRNIDMDPPYQRRPGIWSPADKALLIDTMINEYDMPKLYLADFSYSASPLNAKSLQYAVIDGKQRLEAIFDFFDNKISLAKAFLYSEDPSLRLDGLTYKDLKSNYPEVSAKFENFNLAIMTVITDEEGKINELFVRLNRNKSLTGAEIRNAMPGVVPGLIRALAEHEFFKSRIRFATARSQDKNAAGKLLLVEFRGGLTDTKKQQIDGLVEDALRADAEEDDFERAAERVRAGLDRMCEAFVPRDPLLSSQGPVTLYYWLLRRASDGQLPAFRNLLVEFERARQANRTLVKRSGPDAVGVRQDILGYENLSRSINDQGSLARMHEVLDAWLGGSRS